MGAINRTCKICNETKLIASFYARKYGYALTCIDCERTKAREWYANNKSRSINTTRKWRADNRVRNQQSQLKRDLQRAYGITIEEAQHLYTQANNKCQICGTAVSGKNRHIDHDHITKKIRGILCDTHNRGLGYFQDSSDMLEKALNYLKRTS